MKNPQYRIVVIILVYSLIIFGGSWFGIKPLVASVQSSADKFQAHYQDYVAAQQKLSQMTTLNQSRTEIESAKLLSAKALPPSMDEDRLTLTIEKLVSDYQLKMANFSLEKPKAGNATTGLDVPGLGCALEVSGDYNKIREFVDGLEQISRIAVIDTLTYNAKEGNSVFSASLHFRVFAESITN